MALTLASTIKLNSGYDMPRLGFGVYQNTGESCTTACIAALKTGYRHIDSAVVYRNEAEVGQAVRAAASEGVRREEVFVTTKITTRWAGYTSTAKMVDESLKKFGFEYIDLYLIHDPFSGKEKRLDTYRALLDAQKQGKIRSVGVSNYGVHHLEEIRAAGYPTPSVNQIELHPYCQQRPIAAYCAEHDIIVQAYSPLVRGRIASDDAIRRIAKAREDEGIDPFRILVRWSLQKGYVPLPKSERADRILSNADVYHFELTEEEMNAIDALDRREAGAVSWNPVNSP